MPNQSFADPATFSVQVQPPSGGGGGGGGGSSPPAASLSFDSSPSGTQSVYQYDTLALSGALQLTVTNSGGLTGTFAVNASISGPVSGSWSLSGGTSPVTLGPGQSATFTFSIDFQSAGAAYDGTYTTTVAVSIDSYGTTYYTDPTTFAIQVQ